MRVLRFPGRLSRFTKYTRAALLLALSVATILPAALAQDGKMTSSLRQDSRTEVSAQTGPTGLSASFAVADETGSGASSAGARAECVGGLAAGHPCRAMNLVSFLPIAALGGTTGVGLNDIWGWQDPETGRRYAIVGRTNGTSFVEVSDPEHPVYLGSLPARGGRNTAWRDIKVYRDHAYIVADSQPAHGLQVFDLRTLRTVTTPTIFVETGHYFGFGSSHNIVINEETGFAYAVGASGGQSPTPRACAGGLVMIDLAVPAAPQFAGCFNHPGTGRANTGYTHDAQCVVYRGPDSRFQGREICFGSNETALSVADVTDKAAPVAIGLGEYPGTRYAHQGWLTTDQRYFFLGDELDELNDGGPIRTLVFDVSKLDDPVVVTEYTSSRSGIDHNMYTVGDRLYQANYRQGIHVLDVSNPERPNEVGRFDTTPIDGASVWDGTWSVYPYFGDSMILASSIGQGLFVVELDAAATSTGVEPAAVPSVVTMTAAWPNPFIDRTVFEARFKQAGPARVEVLDVLGRVQQVLLDGMVEAGSSQEFSISGAGLAPGTYVLRVQTETGAETRTIVRAR